MKREMKTITKNDNNKLPTVLKHFFHKKNEEKNKLFVFIFIVTFTAILEFYNGCYTRYSK